MGFLTTLPGPGGALGAGIRDGFESAVKHARGELGGLSVVRSIRDDQMNPDVGREENELLLKRDRLT